MESLKRIVVFGADGRAGQAIVAQGRRRGHEVTEVVRRPREGAVTGDVTDPASVAAVAGDDSVVDAVVHAAADLTVPGFFSNAVKALQTSLTTQRLVVIGLASVLPTESGVPLMDTPGYPQEYRAFYESHGAGVDALRATGLDWVVLSPAGDFDHGGDPAGRYEIAPAEAESRITYEDFALAVVDQIESPSASAVHIGVAQPAGSDRRAVRL